MKIECLALLVLVYLEDLKNILTSYPRSRSQHGSMSEADMHPPLSSLQQHQHQHLQQQGMPRTDSTPEERFRSVIILVPMRLGGETLNEIYIPCVKSMLAHDNCIGIIGGRPKHSLYFVGWQGRCLLSRLFFFFNLHEQVHINVRIMMMILMTMLMVIKNMIMMVIVTVMAMTNCSSSNNNNIVTFICA